MDSPSSNFSSETNLSQRRVADALRLSEAARNPELSVYFSEALDSKRRVRARLLQSIASESPEVARRCIEVKPLSEPMLRQGELPPNPLGAYLLEHIDAGVTAP